MDRLEQHAKHIIDVVERKAPLADLIVFAILDKAICEVATMCKNIRETSLGEADKLHRIETLAQATGMQPFTLKKLCS